MHECINFAMIRRHHFTLKSSGQNEAEAIRQREPRINRLDETGSFPELLIQILMNMDSGIEKLLEGSTRSSDIQCAGHMVKYLAQVDGVGITLDTGVECYAIDDSRAVFVLQVCDQGADDPHGDVRFRLYLASILFFCSLPLNAGCLRRRRCN